MVLVNTDMQLGYHVDVPATVTYIGIYVLHTTYLYLRFLTDYDIWTYQD